uniref:Thioredoxin domain-containing protein n=1 Tax=Amorphochlora amoebiformis TaxID=1561963 RepID=A0A7S0CSQ2_9EUKA|mmetsp:Transcript_12856/g.20320  ORF Transcript_12856/g.20320 Transcript_12856/m.20320 type:complete len:261 (+) Transcript_12856:76-858(+)
MRRVLRALNGTRGLSKVPRRFFCEPTKPPSAPPTKVAKVRWANWPSVVGMGIVGAGVVLYYNYEKDRVLSDTKVTVIGKPMLGGPYDLVDAETGQRVTSEDYHGQYTLLYFGFSKCPDICPTELKKMGKALDIADAYPSVPTVTPVFITIDPKRDTPGRLKAYKKDYHPRLVCLTGTNDEIQKVSKAFRVYFSAPAGDDTDYLVDHSIFFYLMGTKGEFLEYFGKNLTAEEVATKMIDTIKQDVYEQKQTQNSVQPSTAA